MEVGPLSVEHQRHVSSGAAAKDSKGPASWTKSFTRTLAWEPLTVPWSMQNGPLPVLGVSLLAAYPACRAIADLRRQTA